MLHDELKDINADLKAVNERIATWVRQNEENKRFESASTYRANLLGKTSLFLELSPAQRPTAVSLDVLCSGQLIPDTELSFSSATAGASPSLN